MQNVHVADGAGIANRPLKRVKTEASDASSMQIPEEEMRPSAEDMLASPIRISLE